MFHGAKKKKRSVRFNVNPARGGWSEDEAKAYAWSSFDDRMREFAGMKRDDVIGPHGAGEFGEERPNELGYHRDMRARFTCYPGARNMGSL